MRGFSIPNRDVRGEGRGKGFFPRRRADVRANLAEDVPGKVLFDLAGLGRAPAATRLWQYRVAAERERDHMLIAQPARAAIRTAVDAPTDR
jgi:hypothetical protein